MAGYAGTWSFITAIEAARLPYVHKAWVRRGVAICTIRIDDKPRVDGNASCNAIYIKVGERQAERYCESPTTFTWNTFRYSESIHGRTRRIRAIDLSRFSKRDICASLKTCSARQVSAVVHLQLQRCEWVNCFGLPAIRPRVLPWRRAVVRNIFVADAVLFLPAFNRFWRSRSRMLCS